MSHEITTFLLLCEIIMRNKIFIIFSQYIISSKLIRVIISK